jgi:hypothetical protein
VLCKLDHFFRENSSFILPWFDFDDSMDMNIILLYLILAY